MRLLWALFKLWREIRKARKKHPSNRWLFEALCEEVGELADDFHYQDRDPCITSTATLALAIHPRNKEALQSACVAMRIYLEGTSEIPTPDVGSFDIDPFAQMSAIGKTQKARLTAMGVPK